MPALTAAFNVALALAIVVTVFSLGVSHDLPALLAPLRRVRTMLLLVGVNVLVVPALAWGLTGALPLTAEQAAAVTLCAVGAGGAGGLKAVQLSRVGDLPLALSSVMLLQVLNLVTVPVWTGLVIGSTVPPSVVVGNLVALILAPWWSPCSCAGDWRGAATAGSPAWPGRGPCSS